jgi:hypothetical protein
MGRRYHAAKKRPPRTFASRAQSRLDSRHLSDDLFRVSLASIVPCEEASCVLNASVDLSRWMVLVVEGVVWCGTGVFDRA